MERIRSSCGYSNITELITDNVDYVIHHVALKLRNLKRNKKVFDVLDVIIVHCEQQSLTVLCDITEVRTMKKFIVRCIHSLKIFVHFISDFTKKQRYFKR